MRAKSALKITAAGLLFASAECTVLVDHDSKQCSSDSDCDVFGEHPICRSGVCVPSGLGPVDCFYGTPQTQAQFLNQCSNAQCFAFDSCAHHVCDGNTPEAGLVPLPPPDAGPTIDAGGSDGAVSDGALSDGAGPGVNAGEADAGGSEGGSGDGDSGTVSKLPKCFDPSQGRGQVVYMTGSSNFPPLLAQLAPLLARPAAGGLTPVYQITSSCGGVKSILGSKDNDHRIKDPLPSANAQYAAYFAANGDAVPCTLGPDGVQVDVGESDIFASTCTGFSEPQTDVEHVLGPNQAMAFVVPGTSTEKSITAEAAFAVFGRGGKNLSGAPVSPWDNPSLYYVRNANTGTQQMIGRAISVPADKFWGIDRSSAKRVAETMPLLDPTLAQKAIGIISVDFYDSNRVGLKALGFTAYGQGCAYLPDSTPYSYDKRNVRDGHYPIWGPLHFFAAASNGVPTSSVALAYLGVISGNVVTGDLSNKLLDAYISTSLVPACAMSVQRNTELGPLMPYAPRGQCGCYFEAKANGKAPPACSTCAGSEDCRDPQRPFCSHGFCEAQ